VRRAVARAVRASVTGGDLVSCSDAELDSRRYLVGGGVTLGRGATGLLAANHFTRLLNSRGFR
jgi:hypothetical protein